MLKSSTEMIRNGAIFDITRKVLSKSILSLRRQPDASVIRYCSSNTKTWSYSNLNMFGRLVIRNDTPNSISFNVRPVDPQECPTQDIASVQLSSDGETLRDCIKCEQNGDVISIQTVAEDMSQTTVEADPLQCDVEVPIAFNCDIKLQGQSSVSVSQLENQDIDVQVQHGRCHLKSIKTGNAQIKSASGPVVAESSLQGNTYIQSEQGTISVHKAVGPTLTVQSSEGDILLQNLYTDRSVVRTTRGDVHIGSCHRDVTVNIAGQGNLKADSVDGRLNAEIKSGNVDMFVAKHEWVNVSTGQGDVTVKLPEELASSLEARADTVIVDSGLEMENRQDDTGPDQQQIVKGMLVGDSKDRRFPVSELGHLLLRSSQGTVDIKCQDWLSSLNIGQLKSS